MLLPLFKKEIKMTNTEKIQETLKKMAGTSNVCLFNREELVKQTGIPAPRLNRILYEQNGKLWDVDTKQPVYIHLR